jgi:tartrate dehydratase beta subunit/fumarate hydratase class I family protein
MTRYKDSDEIMIVSPITGKDMEVAIRAFCAKCGCLVSHGKAATVTKTVNAFVECKKCGCGSLTIKHTAIEMINGEILKLRRK